MSESPMHVLIDVDKCIAVGQCILAAPHVFDLDDAGIVVLLDPHPPESERGAVLNAITRCPADVIWLAEQTEEMAG